VKVLGKGYIGKGYMEMGYYYYVLAGMFCMTCASQQLRTPT